MTDGRQVPAELPVVLVSGPAGSGKSTLGRAVARRLQAVPLDLDVVTNPLLDSLSDLLPGDHWLSGPHAATVRAGRYAALRALARDVLAAGLPVVLVAPWTAELRGGTAWEDLVRDLAPHPVHVVHLTAEPTVLAARRTARGEPRDAHRMDVPLEAPVVPHQRLDAALPTAEQVGEVLGRIDVSSHSLAGRTFDAVLCDLDGTLVDSTPAVLRSWARLGAEFGFPGDAVQRNHGRPAEALLVEFLPPVDVVRAVARVEEFEVADTDDVTALPGAAELLAALPADRVAVVTSATRPVARARLRAAGLPEPAVFLTREDVAHPKPDPEPFLRAAAALGVDPTRCLVLEDAPSGVAAGRAAGCTVVALAGTTGAAAVRGADLVVASLHEVPLRPGIRWG